MNTFHSISEGWQLEKQLCVGTLKPTSWGAFKETIEALMNQQPSIKSGSSVDVIDITHSASEGSS